MSSRYVLPALVALLGGCGKDTGPSHFPLEPGLRWTYQVSVEVGNDRQMLTLTESNSDTVDLNGIAHTVRVTDQGTRYYLAETEQGVFRSAKRTIVETRPRRDDDPRWVLKQPYQVGTSWSQETHPYVLRRIHPYTEKLARSINFKMAYQIGALDDTVEVPAGRFEHCIRVDGEAQLSIYADGRTGYQDIDINTTEWYAPGVGLVKLERNEPLTGEVFAGGRIVLELEQFGE
ncbi:MAG: hypothetical protein KDI88_07190 [Gammaproteobacteria bacterium]|nr:hypothetical protein [Gammaproteobacteria bacterium]